MLVYDETIPNQKSPYNGIGIEGATKRDVESETGLNMWMEEHPKGEHADEYALGEAKTCLHNEQNNISFFVNRYHTRPHK